MISIQPEVEAATDTVREGAAHTPRDSAIEDAPDDAVFNLNLRGAIMTWNRGARRLFGYPAKQVIGSPVSVLTPDDRKGEEQELLTRVRQGKCLTNYETERRHRNGTPLAVLLSLRPIFDITGRIIGASEIVHDITGFKRAHEAHELVLREMRHRVRNAFALAGSLITLSARYARTPEELAADVGRRINALMGASELARLGATDDRIPREGVTMHALVRNVLAPFVRRGDDQECLVLGGDDMPLGKSCISNVAMILYELASNAAKYGALMSPQGVVRIDCTLRGGEFTLVWREDCGGQRIAPPQHEGFGSFLTNRIVKDFLTGRISREWKPEGLIVQLALPAARLRT